MSERYCDLMRQGFMKGAPVAKPTAAERKELAEQAHASLPALMLAPLVAPSPPRSALNDPHERTAGEPA